VRQFVGDDYAAGMSRLYEDPPTTQEQWLHPEKWLVEKDLPRKVTWGADLATSAGPKWKVLHTVPFGELDVLLYLSFLLPREDNPAERAANGWDAGAYLALESEDASLPLIWIEAMAYDSPRDAAEAGHAFADAVEAAAEGTFRSVGDWALSAPAGKPARQQLDYRTSNGRGRILVRGDELLIADGVPETRFDAVWTAVEATRID
jgi:hypothetical protein